MLPALLNRIKLLRTIGVSRKSYRKLHFVYVMKTVLDAT